MRLEDVTAEIRPRAPWESIDLGCALARQHIKTIWKSWFVTIIPLWGVLALLLRDHPWWFLLCLWWLKPIYDRVILFIVSQALFGAAPSVKTVLKAWPRLLVKNLWSALIIRRFSPSRSLTLPVSELEGLKGKVYTQRVQVLEVNGGEGASVATFAGLLLEFVAFGGVLMLVFAMAPGEVSSSWGYAISEFFSNDDFSYFSSSLVWVAAVTWMFAITLMEPFYVSAGFALYVNSRTLTEGWDIELAFKRMGSRISNLKNGAKKTTLLLMVALVGTCFLMSTHNALAESDTDEPSIEQIMQSEDFTIHTKIEKVPVKKEVSSFNWRLPAFMGLFGHVLFYIVLALVLGGLAYLIYKNKHLLGGASGIDERSSSPSKIREVMGMDVTPESLPADVVSAARSAWEAGDHQLALSLLYRGSITWFINREELPIEESDTEGDCLRHVEQMSDKGFTPYFTKLTQLWVSMAYGKKQPDDAAMQSLCDTWPFGQDERGNR